MPADPVATGAHRDDQIALARVANRRDHVGDAGAARDPAGLRSIAPFQILRPVS